ncbi:amino acid permease-domain-containing protein [Obelidium mucronatum]|nr:amino acid permease-domain-containing protein [Obelidium mucronatum]
MGIDSDDEGRLQQLGYKQELFRALDAFANFGVAFTILSEPMSVLPLLYLGLGAGGPRGMLITWPIISAFSAFVAASMSEIVSSYPTSGGLYYWSASLAGPVWAPYASYMTGYFNFLGLTGLTSGTAYAFGQFFVNCFIAQENPAFETGSWPAKLITLFAGIGGLIIAGFLASFGSQAVNVLGKACFWLNSVGLSVIVLSVFFASPTKLAPGELFNTWSNLSGFPDAWAATISVLLACLTYTGYDSAAHLAEETKNPAVQGPRSIGYAIIGTFISGYVALFFMLSTIDPGIYSEIYENGSYGLMIIFLNSVGLNAGIVFNVLLMLLAITNMFGLLMTHARMAFAFSRDGALPGSKWLHVLNSNQVPLIATIVIVVIDCVILVPSLYSVTLYAAINSFGVIGIYLAYFVPIFLRIVRSDKFPQGPFNLGAFGVPVGIISVLFLAFSSIALVLPTVYTDEAEYVLEDNVTLDHDAYVAAYLQNFNWAPVVVCGVFIVSNLFWVLNACKWFKGPPIDTETKWARELHLAASNREASSETVVENAKDVEEFIVARG